RYAISEILQSLPVNFSAALFVVLHRGETERFSIRNVRSRADTDVVVTAFARHTALPVQSAVDFQEFRPGNVYVAPSNQHLYLENGVTRLENSPKENMFRPSIDVLFRSAAYVYGYRAIGVIVSGMLRDGAAGLWQIKKRGGMCIAQDPEEAQY